MKQTDLEKLGLTPEALEKAGLDANVLSQIMELHGKDISKTKKGIEAIEQERDGLLTQLDTANAEIKSYKDMDIDAIKKAAGDWEQKAREAQTESEKQIAALKLSHAVEAELKDTYKALDPTDLIHRLDLTVVKLTDAGLKGLKEQVEPLQQSKAYLFGTPSNESEETTQEEGAPALITGSTKQTQPSSETFTVGDAIRSRLSGK